MIAKKELILTEEFWIETIENAFFRLQELNFTNYEVERDRLLEEIKELINIKKE